MPTEAAVDSSVLIALVTPEKSSDWVSERMKKYGYLHVLDLSYYEVANAIRHKVSSKFSQVDAFEAFKQAEKIMNLFAVHSFSEVIQGALDKAFTLDITVYDAAFLELAERLNIPMLTLDMQLAKALEITKYNRLIVCP
jgi:predicted nucleic acid-binding protein